MDLTIFLGGATVSRKVEKEVLAVQSIEGLREKIVFET